MMRLGIFAKTYPGKTALEVLQKVKEAGFEVTHFNFAALGMEDMPKEISPAIIEELHAAMEETGIPVVGISGTFNMAHPDPGVRQIGLQRLEVIAAASHQLNIPMISLCTGSRNAVDKWAPHPDNQSTGAWRDMIRSMEKAILIAEENNIYLGVEPELANVVHSPLKAFELITEMQTDRIKIILDPANLFEKSTPDQVKSLISSALDLLGPFVIMAHAKDRDQPGAFVPPGQGIIPFEFLIRQMQIRKMDVPLVAHGFSAHEALAVSTYLKSLFP